MRIAEIGLLVIAVSWIIQLVYAWKGKKEIQPTFIVCYMIVVLLIAIADYISIKTLSYFELSTLIAAGLVLFKISKK
jgi:hypothetical protein